jgi:hypothetical protein
MASAHPGLGVCGVYGAWLLEAGEHVGAEYGVAPEVQPIEEGALSIGERAKGGQRAATLQRGAHAGVGLGGVKLRQTRHAMGL